MSLLSLPVSEQLGQALGWMVVHSLWQATAVAVLAGIVSIVLRHRSAALRYWVGNAALLCILLLAVGTFAWYYADGPVAADVAPRQTMATELVSAMNPQQGGALPFVDTLARHEGQAATDEHFSLATLQDYTRQNLPLIVTIWFLGVTFFLLRLLGSVSYIYYLRGRMNFPPDPYWDEMLVRLCEKLKFDKAVSLVESALVRSPLTLGHVKPMILFPIGVLNRLSEQEVEAILAHELAHIVRRDYLFNIIQSFVEALFYYHPAVWWLSAQVRNERESACDEMAISLTGDKIAYAKALVTIQEMAYFPLTTALAFAGQGKSQFLRRMQRILQHTTIKRNVMEKIIATALIVGTVLVLSFAQDRDDVIILPPSVVDATGASATNAAILDMPLSGIWQSDEKDGELCISFSSKRADSHWMNDLCLRQDKPTIPAADGPFSIAREAGVMEMSGKKDGTEGYGKFKFVPSDDFKKYLEGRGMTGITDGLLMHCFFSNINRAYFDFLSKQGYANVTTQQLQDLAMFRMEPEAIKTYRDIYAKGGSGTPTLEQMAQMRIHGIDADYLAALDKMGYRNLSADDIMQMKVHNIDTMFVMGLRRAGYSNIGLDDLMQLRTHGVDGQVASKINKQKNRRLSVEELIDVHIGAQTGWGVESPVIVEEPADVEDVKEGEEAFFNIDKGYADMMNSLGVGRFSNPELQAARSLALDKSYIIEMQRANVKGLDPANLLAMKGLGVDTRTVRKYKEMGISMTADELVEGQTLGVDEDFIRWSWSTGCESRDLGDFVNCKNRLNNQSGNGGSTGRGRSNSSGNGNTGYYGNADDNGNIGYNYSAGDQGDVNGGTIRSTRQKEVAKKKKEEQEYNIFGTFICMMMDDGLIEAGQNIRLTVTHTVAKVNGRSLTSEQYRRYYNAAKANSGGSLPATFECRLTGEIHGCDGTSFQMSGQMNTNFGN